MSSLLIHQFYAEVAPWAGLALLFIGRNPHPGLRRKIAAVLLAVFVLFIIPIGGWSIAAWLRVLEPNPSVTLTLLLLIALTSRLAGQAWFRRQDWNAAWFFGAVATLVLYPMGLGLTGIDPYSWGWGPVLPLIVTTAATLLLLRGNRFGVILLFPFAGWVLGIQESTNFWNTLADPFYGAVSLILTAILLIRRCSSLTSGTVVID
ncbi:MAG: hypothetical protein EBR40_08765 [Proteobacteria bacterium]|nr:hypothetical protein [Pseudomonadota bacterium]